MGIGLLDHSVLFAMTCNRSQEDGESSADMLCRQAARCLVGRLLQLDCDGGSMGGIAAMDDEDRALLVTELLTRIRA